jgi:hypothetical protein
MQMPELDGFGVLAALNDSAGCLAARNLGRCGRRCPRGILTGPGDEGNERPKSEDYEERDRPFIDDFL